MAEVKRSWSRIWRGGAWRPTTILNVGGGEGKKNSTTKDAATVIVDAAGGLRAEDVFVCSGGEAVLYHHADILRQCRFASPRTTIRADMANCRSSPCGSPLHHGPD